MGQKRGRPVVLGITKLIEVTLGADMYAALNQLVDLTGEARTSLVRRGIAAVLAEAGLWDTAANVRLIPTTRPNPAQETR